MRKIFLFLFLLSFFSINTNIISINDAFANGSEVGDSTGTFSGNGMSMQEVICNVLNFLTGGVGRSLAAFACIGISLAFLTGKVAWTLILTFSLGMACIFGAPAIITAFTGGDNPCESLQ